jgi:hypothetical protein
LAPAKEEKKLTRLELSEGPIDLLIDLFFVVLLAIVAVSL